MLEGLLVDLVPMSATFIEYDHKWQNSVASYWASMGDYRLLTRERTKARRAERSDRDTSDRSSFGIQTKDGKPIGSMSVKGILPHHRIGMLGAMIGEPDYWGGGYGTDALLLLVDYAFEWLDLRKVWLETMAMNARVMRQMEKVGFTLEARHREATLVDGAWVDSLVYGLRYEEWPGRPAMIEKLGLRVR
jgi:RimJ/RimL family protein N-acetyltransferase